MKPIYRVFVAASLVVVACQPHPNDFNGQMLGVLKPYLVVQKALANDSLDGVADAARDLRTAATALDIETLASDNLGSVNNKELASIPQTVISAADALLHVTDVDDARTHFRALSKAVGFWANDARPANIEGVYCSMTQGGWVQEAGPIRNPYHGKSMLECGEKMF